MHSRHVLLVEDNSSVLRTLQRMLEEDGYTAVCAASKQEMQRILASEDGESLLACVLDYCLPDAPEGEALVELLKRRIPTIVLTARNDLATREQVLLQPVVDYIPKENPAAYEYTLRMLRRIEHNPGTRVLVVDDSSAIRGYLSQLLQRQLYEVIEAANGEAALAQLGSDPGIRLVLTDHDMPGMNGVRLCSEIRRFRSQEELAIIGISSSQDSSMSARFIKAGADDFLTKPFNHEEFFCRVTRNIEYVENLQALSRAAHEDLLTGLPNRRSFFERVQKQPFPHALAMLDIDNFKQINDNYGHDIGDQALRWLGSLLAETFGREQVARLGGEEFVILLPLDTSPQPLLEAFRQQVGSAVQATSRGELQLTISIGAATGQMEVSQLLKQADEQLYQAKLAGRNRVSVS
ncbi:diguanylate cyclase (GGDEF) domain-containing protein [Vogesella sp. LIG4]|nr:diguanylate cyclase (GGDEF) domain-containing protein [Vogesella sp. LIG4]